MGTLSTRQQRPSQSRIPFTRTPLTRLFYHSPIRSFCSFFRSFVHPLPRPRFPSLFTCPFSTFANCGSDPTFTCTQVFPGSRPSSLSKREFPTKTARYFYLSANWTHWDASGAGRRYHLLLQPDSPRCHCLSEGAGSYGHEDRATSLYLGWW